MTVERVGFDEIAEVGFLRKSRHPDRVFLSEIKTQVGEDVGLVEFSRFYKMAGDEVVDEESDLRLVEVCQGEEEKSWMRKIEKGLLSGKNMLQMRPKRKKGEVDCVDFWRREGEGVGWTRVEVEGLRGGVRLGPVETEMRLAEVMGMFELAKKRTGLSFETIRVVAEGLLIRFRDRFGDKLLVRPELIRRFYSAVHEELGRLSWEPRVDERWLNGLNGRLLIYTEAPMVMMRARESFGCSGSTMVGVFGQPVRIETGGGQTKLVRGPLPEGEDWKKCSKCGYWYKGETCSVCEG